MRRPITSHTPGGGPSPPPNGLLAQQLVEEERVAARALAVGGGVAGGVMAGEHGGDRVLVEPSQRELDQRAFAAQVGERRRHGLRQLGLAHADRRSGRAPRAPSARGGAAGAASRDRPSAGRRARAAAGRSAASPRAARGRPRTRDSARPPGRRSPTACGSEGSSRASAPSPSTPLALDRRQAGEVALERLDPRLVREQPLLVAAPEQHRGALGVDPPRELAEQGRLADPGLAGRDRDLQRARRSFLPGGRRLASGCSRPSGRVVRASGAGSGSWVVGAAVPTRPRRTSSTSARVSGLGGTRSSRLRRSASWSATASAAGRSPAVASRRIRSRCAPSPSGSCSMRARVHARPHPRPRPRVGQALEHRRDVGRVLAARLQRPVGVQPGEQLAAAQRHADRAACHERRAAGQLRRLASPRRPIRAR